MLKGIILAGGTGSRLSPLTVITNKHLLPIYDRPMISFAVQAVVEAGVTELMIVTGGTHAGEFVRLLGSGHDHGVDRLCYAYQERPGGIAHALALAEQFADGDQVVVMLADNIFEYSIAPLIENAHRNPRRARLLLAELDDETHLRHLGVPAFAGDRIVRIVEKPQDPPSRYAATGIYVYDSTVFDIIRTLVPSQRGELEITDVNNHYIRQGALDFDVAEGWWGDAGESIDAYYRVNDFVRESGANKAVPRRAATAAASLVARTKS
ncbi:sugar phosphate nucleotidyltransferase [Nocardia sp. NPDC051570]|uniref:sugar phosphate nucleotidyltransferase n=1 Tax=Nocardia sp. NPDC051570 TaxID=3364324 RepID=UPI0037971F73